MTTVRIYPSHVRVGDDETGDAIYFSAFANSSNRVYIYGDGKNSGAVMSLADFDKAVKEIRRIIKRGRVSD